MQQSWRIVDVTPIAEANKYTFYKPSAEAISLIKPGTEVKLVFEFDRDDPKMPNAERMWVEVLAIDGEHFTGSLDNEPAFIKDLKYGTIIEFQAKHIINTDLDFEEKDNLVDRYIHRCIVSDLVLKREAKVGYLSREDPPGPWKGDILNSGWCIMAGTESDEYANDPDHFHFVSLGVVLNWDDSILPYLDAPVGSAFERDEATGAFVPSN